MPHYLHQSKIFAVLLNLRDQIPGLAWLSELLFGFSRKRRLPRIQSDRFRWQDEVEKLGPVKEAAPEVVLLVDTFNTCFEPENARAALAVLHAAGYKVQCPSPLDQGRPLCCGRTFLSSGLVEQALTEARRVLETLKPYVDRGVPIIGLEPSCLFTFRDEFPSLLPGDETSALAEQSYLLEEFLAKEQSNGRLHLALKPLAVKQALLHGHCHQKAFATMSAVEQVLSLIPELAVETIASSCCGMAGAFGYDAKHYDVSMKMGELSLFPAVRKAPDETLIIADGTSCRQQIQHGTGRQAMHVARVLQMALVDA